MKIGTIKEAKEDILAIFFLTQQKVIDKAECRRLMNDVRKEIGIGSEISEEEFNVNFSAPKQPPMPKEVPKENVKHDGQHHEVKVNVPEGQQQVVEAQKGE